MYYIDIVCVRFLRDHFVKRIARNASPNGGDASRVGKLSCCTSGFTEAGRLAPICACIPSYVLMFLCLPRQRLPNHATASALMFLEATRTLVRGRQPRSGLVCILCKLMFLCFRGKRLIHATSYVLMSLCSYASRVSGCQATLRRQPSLLTY